MHASWRSALAICKACEFLRSLMATRIIDHMFTFGPKNWRPAGRETEYGATPEAQRALLCW